MKMLIANIKLTKAENGMESFGALGQHWILTANNNIKFDLYTDTLMGWGLWCNNYEDLNGKTIVVDVDDNGNIEYGSAEFVGCEAPDYTDFNYCDHDRDEHGICKHCGEAL